MICLFCKVKTDGTEPLEHILPESLGNEDHILKRGVVCGKCNNYFASKVEKPFLEDPVIVSLRFHEAVPSKKGRIPIMQGFIPQIFSKVDLHRDPKTMQTSVHIPSEDVEAFQSLKQGRVYLSAPQAPEVSLIVSRFIAKVALEALANRLDCKEDWIAELVDKPELDEIRDHARYGKTDKWPISIRSIYERSTRWKNLGLKDYQIVHEFDFLFMEENELYFVLAIFGYEFVINMGGPELEGWEKWLKQNENVSPLHSGKNSDVDTKLVMPKSGSQT